MFIVRYKSISSLREKEFVFISVSLCAMVEIKVNIYFTYFLNGVLKSMNK